jgi:hypothetical protein
MPLAEVRVSAPYLSERAGPYKARGHGEKEMFSPIYGYRAEHKVQTINRSPFVLHTLERILAFISFLWRGHDHPCADNHWLELRW